MFSPMEFHPEVHHYDIFLVGNTGVGKSASGNTLLGIKVFNSRKSSKPVTVMVQKESISFDGVRFDVYDTPGLFNPETQRENNISEWKNLLHKSTCPVILLVMKADGVSQVDERAADLIEDVIPEEIIQNVWILFTRGDELEREDLTIEEFIEDSHQLKEIVRKFKNRYHVFNNFSKSPQQVRMLIYKIKEAAETISLNMGCFTPADHPDMRIVLVGKTGAGKSATGNTVLREGKFKSATGLSSVTSTSIIQYAEVSGRTISVIDTPGLFDTNLTHGQLSEEIGKSIYLSRPGPHAFLYVQSLNVRFTTQEKDVIQRLGKIFGQNMEKYTMVVFTHGDLLKEKSVDEFIQENTFLKELIEQCDGRYHIINNTQRKKQQVTDLLEKIDSMIEQNGGKHYTSEMYDKAKEYKKFEEFLYKCEDSLAFSAGVWTGSGSATALVIGAAIGGAAGGPLGAGIGAGIGALAGIVAGLGTGIGVHKGMRMQRQKQNRKLKEHQSTTRSGDDEDSDMDETLFSTELEDSPFFKKNS